MIETTPCAECGHTLLYHGHTGECTITGCLCEMFSEPRQTPRGQDVMTDDGRRVVAKRMLDEWRWAEHRYEVSVSAWYKSHWRAEADKLLEEILQLMGVDS